MKQFKQALKLHLIIPMIIVALYLGQFFGIPLSYFGMTVVFLVVLVYLRKTVPNLARARMIAVGLMILNIILILISPFLYANPIRELIAIAIMLISLSVFLWQIHEGTLSGKIINELALLGLIASAVILFFLGVIILFLYSGIDGIEHMPFQEGQNTYIVDGCDIKNNDWKAFRKRYTDLIFWLRVEDLPVPKNDFGVTGCSR